MQIRVSSRNLATVLVTVLSTVSLASRPVHAETSISSSRSSSPSSGPSSSLRPHWYSLHLADVVVQGQGGTATPAAPVAQAVPVAESPSRHIVHTDVDSNHNYMGTIAMSAIGGAVLGVLVGGAIYYLADNQRARNIVYWGAGGVLLGAGVGVVQVMVQESRASAAVSTDLSSDPSRTFRVALYRRQF
jgi:hypothetical protein